MDGQASSLVFLQYLTTVFDNIADGILLINVDSPNKFSLAVANKPFFEFTGYPETTIGKDASKIVSRESHHYQMRQYRKVVRIKQPVDYLHWTDTPAGMRALEVRLVPILNTTGDCAQIAAIVHDATEREQLRDEVSHLRATVRGIRQSA